MDKDVVCNYVRISADITATISTVGAWASIAIMCVYLGGPIEPPLVAGTMTTIIVWALRKLET